MNSNQAPMLFEVTIHSEPQKGYPNGKWIVYMVAAMSKDEALSKFNEQKVIECFEMKNPQFLRSVKV